MAERKSGAARPTSERTPEARRADHEAIDRLADELLPSLVARLGASGLGELEVREGAWRVRLRRPPGVDRRIPAGGRAAPGRGSSKAGTDDARARDGLGSPGHGGAAGSSTSEPKGASASAPARAGDAPLPPLTAVGPDAGAVVADGGPAVATSPAVGVFRARAEIRSGTRVRAGDRLGTVDVLGVAVEVSAPVDGIVATALVEDGDAVEYGQPLVAVEPLAVGGHPGSAAGAGAAVAQSAVAAATPPHGEGGATPAAGGA